MYFRIYNLKRLLSKIGTEFIIYREHYHFYEVKYKKKIFKFEKHKKRFLNNNYFFISTIKTEITLGATESSSVLCMNLVSMIWTSIWLFLFPEKQFL